MEKYLINISNFDIFQIKGLQSTTLDSLLIADFVKINMRTKKVLEIGSGFGIVSMIIARKSKADIIGAEINKLAYEVSVENKEKYNLDNLNFMNIDILDYEKYFSDQSFDVIVSNPPYFKENNIENMKSSEDLNRARIEGNLTIEKIIQISSRLLKNGAYLYLVFRTERLIEILNYVSKTNLTVKRIRPIYTKNDDSGSLISLLELKKNAKEGFILESPIYIYGNDGEKSEYVRQLYGR